MPDLDHWKRYIQKLDDRFGRYVLVVTCKACRHCRYIKPEALARIVGWTAEIAPLMDRMRCSKCGAYEPEWDVEKEPRPRK
jgi:hypothetical protein